MTLKFIINNQTTFCYISRFAHIHTVIFLIPVLYFYYAISTSVSFPFYFITPPAQVASLFDYSYKYSEFKKIEQIFESNILKLSKRRVCFLSLPVALLFVLHFQLCQNILFIAFVRYRNALFIMIILFSY